MERFFYQNSIIGFLTDSEDTILGVLAKNNSFDLVDLQRNAWLYEISFLKNLLRDEKTGQIIFEYSIPRLGKRIDVICFCMVLFLFWNLKLEQTNIAVKI